MSHLGQHLGSPSQLTCLEPEEVDELHQVSNVFGPEMVLPQQLAPHAGLVLCVDLMVVQLDPHLLPCFPYAFTGIIQQRQEPCGLLKVPSKRQCWVNTPSSMRECLCTPRLTRA